MSPAARILIVEDESAMVAGLRYALEKEGYEVEVASDGEAALRSLGQHSPDLVLLDVMLPKRSGFGVLEALRRDGRAVPVVMLTAKGQEIDRVRGLDLGADDYVTKPFSVAELLARIRARLRRSVMDCEDVPERLLIGQALVDLAAMRVQLGKTEHELTLRETDMLRLLWRQRGKPVSRERFLEEVWGKDRFPTTRTVDQHVAKLRQKMELDPGNPRHLLTAFGLGYRLEL